MKYYNIGHTNDIKVIGHYPQTQVSNGYNVDALNSSNKVLPDLFPNFEPNYGLKLNEKSILTDILDRGNLDFGMIVSGKCKSIIEKFKLPPHRFYSVNVEGTDKKYFWFHYISNIWEYIDYEKTQIEVYKSRPNFDIEEIKSFASFNEAIHFKRTLPYSKSLRFGSIYLKNTFPYFDLFEITGIQYFTLISEFLKEELVINNITGLDFLEYNKVF